VEKDINSCRPCLLQGRQLFKGLEAADSLSPVESVKDSFAIRVVVRHPNPHALNPGVGASVPDGVVVKPVRVLHALELSSGSGVRDNRVHNSDAHRCCLSDVVCCLQEQRYMERKRMSNSFLKVLRSVRVGLIKTPEPPLGTIRLFGTVN